MRACLCFSISKIEFPKVLVKVIPMKAIIQIAKPIAIKTNPIKSRLARISPTKPTPWAKTFFKGVDRLREALGDTKLA